tara:strand:+ start:762 stop:953 length:192 start_codon:yes stop_codon:yes gene_type:complete
MNRDFCNNNFLDSNRRQIIHKKKLDFLSYMRDSLERRLASVNASIKTLESQLERDKTEDKELI